MPLCFRVIHDQLETLSQQMVSLQARKDTETQESAKLAESVQLDESGHSSDQLLQVIK